MTMPRLTVEAALQEVQETLDVERSENQQEVEKAQAEKYIKPYRTELQAERHCCECGDAIPKDKPTVICHLLLHLTNFYTSQLIAWCDRCWLSNFGEPGTHIEEVLINGNKVDAIMGEMGGA